MVVIKNYENNPYFCSRFLKRERDDFSLKKVLLISDLIFETADFPT